MACHTAIQPRRTMDYDRVSKEISDLEAAGIIKENHTTRLNHLCNLVIIQKRAKLSKSY